MRMAAGLLWPTEGEVRYDGVPIQALGKELPGYFRLPAPRRFGFYPEFTVYDYLDYVAALKGLAQEKGRGRRSTAFWETFSLADVRKKKITKLSGGMKRRVGIAQALLNDPEVLILDEPTSGLDPGGEGAFPKPSVRIRLRTRIVLISTHIVSDVEYIASRNAVMKEGRIIAQGTTDELLWEMEGKVWSAPDRGAGSPQIRAEGPGGEHPERGERGRVHPVSGGRARGSGLPAKGAPAGGSVPLALSTGAYRRKGRCVR